MLCSDEDWPVVIQYDNGALNNISPTHFTDVIPFNSVTALSEDSFIAVGINFYEPGPGGSEGSAYRWDTGTWSKIPIEDPDVTEQWYLEKIFVVTTGNLAGIYSIGGSGTTETYGLLFKYNESHLSKTALKIS